MGTERKQGEGEQRAEEHGAKVECDLGKGAARQGSFIGVGCTSPGSRAGS